MKGKYDNAPINVLLFLLMIPACIGFFTFRFYEFVPSRAVNIACQWILPLLFILAVIGKYRTDIHEFQIAVLYKQFGVLILIALPIMLSPILVAGWFAEKAAAVFVLIDGTRKDIEMGKLESIRDTHLSGHRYGARNSTLAISLEDGTKLEFDSWSMAGALQQCLGASVSVGVQRNSVGTIIRSVKCDANLPNQSFKRTGNAAA